MKLLPKDPVRTLTVLAYIFLALIFVAFLLPRIIVYLLPVIVAAIISVIINPWVDFMEKKLHINRRIAVIVTILLVISIIGLILFNLIYQAVFFLQNFAQRLPELLNREYVMPEWVAKINEYLIRLPDSMQDFVDDIKASIINNISQVISPATKATINAAAAIASRLPNMLVFTVVLILSTYFMSYDRKKFAGMFKKITSESRFNKMIRVKDKLFELCGAYFRAELIMMGIIFLVLLVGFLVLRVDSPFFIAFVTAVVDAIPVLGTGTVLIPWALAELLGGKYSLALGLIVIYVLAIVVRQFTEPRIVSSQIGLHPLLTISAMYIGLKAVGIIGMILGPIITIIIIKAIEIEKELESEEKEVLESE